jgi:hypothetical protein
VVVEIGQQRGAGSAHRGMNIAVDSRGRHGASSAFRLGDLDVAIVNVPPMRRRRKRFAEGAALPWMHRASRPAVRDTKYSSLAKCAGCDTEGERASLKEMKMKSGGLVLVVSLLTAGASAASAAPATASGPAALALAGVVALYSPLLTADEREAVSAFFVGQSGVRYAKKISVTADKIVCRVSNVDITARSCELTFKGAKQTITGRRASEIFATEAMAGVPSDGAAGSVFESLSKLNCTLDPAEIRQKAGGGASCTFETGQ